MKEIIFRPVETAAGNRNFVPADFTPVECIMVTPENLLRHGRASAERSPFGISVAFYGTFDARLHTLSPQVIAVADVRGVKNNRLRVEYALFSPVMLNDSDCITAFMRRGVAVHDVRYFVLAAPAVGAHDIPYPVVCTHLAVTLLDLGLHHRDYLDRANPGSDIDEMAIGRDPARHDFATLQALLARYHLGLDVPQFGDDVSSSHAHPVAHTEDGIQRAAADAAVLACATAVVAPPLLRDLEDDALIAAYRQVQVPAAISLARLERQGLRLDLRLAHQALDVCAAVEDDAAAVLEKAGLSSPLDDRVTVPQLRAVGALDGPVLTAKGWERLSLRDLALLAPRHPALEALHRFRLAHYAGHGVLRQCVDTADASGRVYPVIRSLGTDTGRPSFANPNLAGLARVFRPIVVPDGPDFGIVEFDYKAQEIGIAAALHGDEALVRDWNEGDIYLVLARRLIAPALGLDVRGIDDERLRQLRDRAKILLLGITYGMSPAGVALRLGISTASAERLLARFFSAYPAIEAGMLRQPILLAQTGAVTTISGLKRHRPITGSLEPWERRWAVNAPVQGSGADVLKVTLPPVMAYAASVGGRVLLPVYDSLVVQLPMPLRQEHVETIRRLMVEGFRGLFPMLKPRVSVNQTAPHCWNHDGHVDSVQRFLDRR